LKGKGKAARKLRRFARRAAGVKGSRSKRLVRRALRRAAAKKKFKIR